ncbi:type II secretion system F family protein [Vibrio comitans]|uniref:Biotin synthase n=1 Tax=Vibrio comitans NBRC 102076 TaxID=1219078 RepID=A0A4Y3IMF0_9VIBR|nr:type II secretion system F family protein [Vibrio comitans]GEA60673.1 biotin synthase [Vibrio comitans NBRC 102076]
MILIFISVSIIAVLMSMLVTKVLENKTRKIKINGYIGNRRNLNFGFVHETLGGFGKSTQKDIRNKFEDAGIYNNEMLRYYTPVKICSFIVLSLMVLLYVEVSMQMLLIFMAIIVIIIVLPDSYLALRKNRLIEKNSRQLPYMIDMMAVCVQTGMTLEAAFKYLGDELTSFDKDLCYQIRKTSDAAEVKGMESALKDFSKRVPTPQVRSFALTLTQNIQYGTSIAPVLSDLAEDFRNEQILVMEEKIGKLSAKMSGPLIIFIMFPILILILAPGITRLMTGN